MQPITEQEEHIPEHPEVTSEQEEHVPENPEVISEQEAHVPEYQEVISEREALIPEHQERIPGSMSTTSGERAQLQLESSDNTATPTSSAT